MFATFCTMDHIEVDGHALEWDRNDRSAVLGVRPLSDSVGPPRAPTSFRFEVREGRLHVALALLPTDRAVDISLQPDILRQVLPIEDGPAVPGSAASTVARWVAPLLEGTSAWQPADRDRCGLLALLSGAALPLLGAAYDRGAMVLGEIPRWAAPALIGPTPLHGARSAFGVKGTRTVARALAVGLVIAEPSAPAGVTTLSPGGSTPAAVDLFGLAVALMAEPTLEPDQLARLLCLAGPVHPQERWPGVEQITEGRVMMRRLGPAGAERLLTDAITRADGPDLLAEVCRLTPGVIDLLPNRPAHRLEDLRDQCRRLLAVDPDPSAGGWSQRRPPAPRTTRRSPVRRVDPVRPGSAPASRTAPAPRTVPASRPAPPNPRRVMRTAPAAPTPTVAPNAPLPHSVQLAALHGTEVATGHRLVIPRTTDELVTWGRLLGNCIGSFGPAVAAGRTLIVGVEADGVLAYCLDLTPEGAVRQFLGARNRVVPPAVAGAVCRRMVEAGVMSDWEPVNRIWLQA